MLICSSNSVGFCCYFHLVPFSVRPLIQRCFLGQNSCSLLLLELEMQNPAFCFEPLPSCVVSIQPLAQTAVCPFSMLFSPLYCLQSSISIVVFLSLCMYEQLWHLYLCLHSGRAGAKRGTLVFWHYTCVNFDTVLKLFFYSSAYNGVSSIVFILATVINYRIPPLSALIYWPKLWAAWAYMQELLEILLGWEISCILCIFFIFLPGVFKKSQQCEVVSLFSANEE